MRFLEIRYMQLFLSNLSYNALTPVSHLSDRGTQTKAVWVYSFLSSQGEIASPVN